MDVLLMKFPEPDVTYTAPDGEPYRTDGYGITGVKPEDVRWAEAIGAVNPTAPNLDAGIREDSEKTAELLSDESGIREESDTSGGFLT